MSLKKKLVPVLSLAAAAVALTALTTFAGLATLTHPALVRLAELGRLGLAQLAIPVGIEALEATSLVILGVGLLPLASVRIEVALGSAVSFAGTVFDHVAADVFGDLRFGPAHAGAQREQQRRDDCELAQGSCY